MKSAGPKTMKDINVVKNVFWLTENIPNDWKSALVNLLCKKGIRTDVAY